MPSKQYGINARLTIGSTATDISAFTLQQPAGQLGAQLSCPLSDFAADPDVGEAGKFEIGVTKGGATQWATLLDDARIVSIGRVVEFPGDQVTVNLVSKIAEKWKLTTRTPITLYDPEQIDISTESQRSRQEIVDEDGAPILPTYDSRESFDLTQLIKFVYEDQLGFGQVLTNIPNFPLPRADFGLRQPWQSIPAGQVQLFEPQYYNEALDRLYIVDPQGTIPTGFSGAVRSISPHAYVQFSRNKQTSPVTNAVLLTYKDNVTAGAGTITDRVDQDGPQEVGTPGEDGFQRTLVNKFIKEFHTDASNPSRITREIVWKVDTRVSAKADGVTREISIESQVDNYDFDWQLKTGYVKTVSLYTKLPGESALMRQVQTETNQILWTQSTTSPNNQLKTWEVTEIVGTILVLGDEDDPDNPAVKQSLYEANRTNNISDDAVAQLGKPIKTIIERWTEIGPDQIEVRYSVVDHLTGRPEANKTVQHTGTVVARLQNNLLSITMLIRDEDSEDNNGFLVPVELNAGDIPFDVARGIAQRILDRHGAQPQQVSISMAGVDVALRRGSLRRVSNRAGDEFLTFITGYSIAGSNLGRADASINQTADGFVLQEL